MHPYSQRDIRVALLLHPPQALHTTTSISTFSTLLDLTVRYGSISAYLAGSRLSGNFVVIIVTVHQRIPWFLYQILIPEYDLLHIRIKLLVKSRPLMQFKLLKDYQICIHCIYKNGSYVISLSDSDYAFLSVCISIHAFRQFFQFSLHSNPQ